MDMFDVIYVVKWTAHKRTSRVLAPTQRTATATGAGFDDSDG